MNERLPVRRLGAVEGKVMMVNEERHGPSPERLQAAAVIGAGLLTQMKDAANFDEPAWADYVWRLVDALEKHPRAVGGSRPSQELPA